MSNNNSEVQIVTFTIKEIQQKSIKLKDYGIADDTRLIIKACQPEQMMRRSSYCSLEYSTLERHCNTLQVTTSDNKTFVFAIDQNEPALIKRIDNSHEFCKPQKYVEPGFTATAVR